MLAACLFMLVASIVHFLVLSKVTPAMPFSRRLGYVVPPALLMLLCSLFFARVIANRIYEEAMRPQRVMVRYLKNLFSGRLTDEAPTTEEEAELTSLLETSQERAEFLQQLANVRENENMRRQFSANVSHELKSPLTSINGYAEMIESGMVGPEDTRRFAGIIYREGIRLLNMINEIIQLSKFDTGYSDFDQREVINLHEIAHAQMETFQQSAAHRNVRLEVEVRGDGAGNAILMQGNRRLMTDVVGNLVSNAIKYSKPEGGYVRIRLSQNEDYVVMMVEDDGIGIAPENQKRVFERFYVVDPGRTRSEGSGTGLGLSLVKHTVASHGGTIHLESALGEGSRFTITLPKDGKVKESEEKDDAED